VQVQHQRDAFYVGGCLLDIRTRDFTTDQLYVEQLTPVADVSQAKLLLFFHGSAFSGSTWLST
jgi:hypothetical protein